MAGENILAREVIELATKGLARVDKDLAAVQKRLRQVEAENKRLTDGMAKSGDQANRTSRSFDNLGQIASRAFFVAGVAITAMVKKGLEGTTTGDRLNESFANLSKQMAGTFAPTVDRITSAVERLNKTFESMSGQQQALTRELLGNAAAAGVAFAAFRKLGPIGAIGGAAATDLALGNFKNPLQNAFDLLPKLQASTGVLQQQSISALEAGLKNLERQLKEREGRGGFTAGLERKLLEFSKNTTERSLTILRGGDPDAAGGGLIGSLKPDVSRLVGKPEGGAGFEQVQDTFRRLQTGALQGEKDKIAADQLATLKSILAALEKPENRAGTAAIGGGTAGLVGL